LDWTESEMVRRMDVAICQTITRECCGEQNDLAHTNQEGRHEDHRCHDDAEEDEVAPAFDSELFVRGLLLSHVLPRAKVVKASEHMKKRENNPTRGKPRGEAGSRYPKEWNSLEVAEKQRRI